MTAEQIEREFKELRLQEGAAMSSRPWDYDAIFKIRSRRLVLVALLKALSK